MSEKLIKSEQGFTIIEVLVGAFIFMLGFSVLIFLLSRLMVDYSVDEASTANRIAQNSLELTIASGDTISFSYSEVVDNVKYNIIRKVAVENNLACVNIEVNRETTNKVISRLYHEFYIYED